MANWKYRIAAAPLRLLAYVGLASKPRTPIAYVVERANWSISWDGKYICRGIDLISPGVIELNCRPERLINRVVHFGSQFQWLAWSNALSSSNRYIATFFHGKREDDAAAARHIDGFLASVPRLERVVTAARLTEDRLLSWGVPRSKLIRIPIAVDLDLFQPVNTDVRRAARARYRIPDDCLVIGSFQKDGVGWGKGDEPKFIKGPDVLVEVIARVAKKRRVFVLLTGPARGFVKRRLDGLDIPYAHDYVEDYLTLPDRYAALDVYLNPSREEGGPKGILEAMASGVSVVSTAVGMAPEFIGANEAGVLTEPGDAVGLAEAILNIDSDIGIRDRRTMAARQAVAQCDWRLVARRHYEEVYQHLT